MLYTMKELLKVAKENQFAVPAFNICSYDMMKAIIEEAERLEAPVILEIHPDEIAYLSDEFVATVRAYAYTSKLPIVIHLDHGGTIEDVLRAIRNGYSSVMIDASLKSFDDNVQITKKVVALAHAVNVSVEAELGTIGNNGSAEGGAETIIYTDPEQAKIFVKETGIDTLAVAIGTAHGLYPKNRTPKLNIDLLKELNQQIDLPFVLHGGSGNPDVEVREAVKYGVAKVNLSSDLKSVFFNALREILSEHPSMYEPNAIYPAANKKVQEVVKHKMEILNTVGKASLY
ncbi:ketose-bisphosphate aldolase [Enterococcus faecium]|uniref:ketose-bisphosphate aldolase n=1 Tax=Enterococcus TaxID=1350 RepID=UPI000CF2C90F|nr:MULTISPECIES: ketose-bisphosphate aldolase [Enterococcus]PQF07649.1 ketose-bisphosphate aldolase [Enterococcus faecium]PQF21185.1 ketose-bisphosphate aldolase [Enterococcus faecium]PQG64043.1 ketose-bisphosphate aldolase [Enterococcus faecium]